MFKKLICILFHRKDWLSFDNMKWLSRYPAQYGVICSRCGRGFMKTRRLTHEEKIRLQAMREIQNDPDCEFKDHIRIEDEL